MWLIFGVIVWYMFSKKRSYSPRTVADIPQEWPEEQIFYWIKEKKDTIEAQYPIQFHGYYSDPAGGGKMPSYGFPPEYSDTVHALWKELGDRYGNEFLSKYNAWLTGG